MTNGEYQKFRIGQNCESTVAQLDAMVESQSKQAGSSVPEVIMDILCDLRHLCDIYELNFSDLDKLSYRGYLEELSWYEEDGEKLTGVTQR